MAGNTANIRIRMDADLKRNHRVTNIRKNDLNQTISEIGNRKPGFIDVEDLNVSEMMKYRGL